MSSHASTDQLMKDLQAAMKDLEALFSASADSGAEQVAEIRDRASAALNQAQAEIRQHANRAGKAADDYVHDSPWTSIAAAAGIAFVVGVLVGRR